MFSDFSIHYYPAIYFYWPFRSSCSHFFWFTSTSYVLAWAPAQESNLCPAPCRGFYLRDIHKLVFRAVQPLLNHFLSTLYVILGHYNVAVNTEDV